MSPPETCGGDLTDTDPSFISYHFLLNSAQRTNRRTYMLCVNDDALTYERTDPLIEMRGRNRAASSRKRVILLKVNFFKPHFQKIPIN